MKWRVPGRYRGVVAPTWKNIVFLSGAILIGMILVGKFGKERGFFFTLVLLVVYAWVLEMFRQRKP